jgi:hypothetical protein
MMKKFFMLFLMLAASSVAVAQSYPLPEYLSVQDLAEWAQRGGMIASGSGAPSASAATGSLYIDLATPTEPLLYRRDAGAWHAIAGGGSSAALESHIASSTDPHGATMTVSVGLTVGTGAAAFEFIRLNSSTVMASGSMFAIGTVSDYADNAAAKAAGLATGTIYRASDTLKIVW